MRIFILSASFVVMASTSFPGSWPQSQEPPKYPPGQMCSPLGDIKGGKQTKEHPCACKRHDEADQTDPELHKMCKAGESTQPSHDAVCKQWCNEQACACPVECDVKGHTK